MFNPHLLTDSEQIDLAEFRAFWERQTGALAGSGTETGLDEHIETPLRPDLADTSAGQAVSPECQYRPHSKDLFDSRRVRQTHGG
jgi:hypothetical protein